MRSEKLKVIALMLVSVVASGHVQQPVAVAGNHEPLPQENRYTRPVARAELLDVDVIVNGVPLDEYTARGRTYIEAIDGAEYALRVRNPLGVRVAVALSVDGLNTIDARRTSAQDASKWVIEPYSSITISGWQMSSSRARRFYFTSERDSYGAKLGQTQNLGVISAAFFRERRPVVILRPQVERDGERGQAEKSPQSAGGESNDSRTSASTVAPRPRDDYPATGIGRSVQHDVTWISMELENRPARELSIRYEYREELVRLGVIPRTPLVTDRRERATGFERRQYSPEPPR